MRRVAILARVVQLRRGRRAPDAAPQALAGHERRIEALEGRVDQLEALLEGLQDAVHRVSVREGGRIGALEKRTEPSEISRALEPGRPRAWPLSAAGSGATAASVRTERRPAGAGLLSYSERLRGCYAWTSSLVLCTTTSPLVIFGGFGSTVSSFCSRTQLDATRVDSSACSEVSK